jgi:hypothetical protein
MNRNVKPRVLENMFIIFRGIFFVQLVRKSKLVILSGSSG